MHDRDMPSEFLQYEHKVFFNQEQAAFLNAKAKQDCISVNRMIRAIINGYMQHLHCEIDNG